MARRSAKRKQKTNKKPSRRFRLSRLLPSARTRRRLVRLVGHTPPTLKLLLGAVAVVVVWLAVNWGYQVARKPSELFFPVSETLYKEPAQTWSTYGSLFRAHSTSIMTPDLLAALAQVEGSGNPVVRTYWRWTASLDPFEIFRPASSAVGMYQFTDGTFAAARRYCIHNHRVAEVGPWYSVRSCWFNSLYTRTVPSHAVELTSAYLDHSVAEVLERYPVPNATLGQKQRLAAMLHLCGAGAAAEYARRGLRFAPGQHCGAHDARAYVERVMSMQRRFAALAARSA
ncbi:MAG TPA: lytic transglycosylase domain-containing protein [Gammaproteobacteria bacterium]|nr:lytic transglycosylase domain-containing protein [Gammaproteobacteria bacterium]